MGKSVKRVGAAHRASRKKVGTGFLQKRCDQKNFVGRGRWQWTVALAALALVGGSARGAGPQAEQPGAIGDLSTLRLGHYHCEAPGPTVDAVATPQPAYDFTVVHASSYRTAKGEGSYLAVGARVTLTNGPLAGMSFRRVSANFLRRLNADGRDGPLRCVRGVANNGDYGD